LQLLHLPLPDVTRRHLDEMLVLHSFSPNHHLTIAAFNGGQGRINMSMQTPIYLRFWWSVSPLTTKRVVTEKAQQQAFTDYELAVTATISYKIPDATVFASNSASDTILFEALSDTGVVLGSASSSLKLVDGGGTRGTTSAKIVGLSDEEIRRITTVQARWKY
jgi:hypothetical protein